jgi:hypothetical protein
VFVGRLEHKQIRSGRLVPVASHAVVRVGHASTNA